jgi:GH25 family lysozyme M1 (1,4-beta-N-acetylmuramidase)
MRKIIDFSCSNGFVHWPLLQENVDAIILKAADGHYTDNGGGQTYYENRRCADKYGVPLAAVYGWWYPPRIDQSILSMAHCLHALADGAPMVLDLELRKGVVWNNAYKANILTHLDALDQLGGKPTIAYLGAEMLSHFVNPDGTYPDLITKRPIWWAEYPNRKNLVNQWDLTTYTFQMITNIPAKFPTKPWAWQFYAGGVIPGISSWSVDLSYELNPIVQVQP